MINYIKAEIYRIFSTKVMYIFFSFIVGSIVLANNILGYFLACEDTMIQNLYSGLKLVNSINIYWLFFIFSFIITQEYSQNTFKNIISYNLSRGKIYLGKLITINLLNIGNYLLFVLVNTVVVLILFKIDSSLNINNVFDFIKHIAYALPLYAGLISLGCFMAFLLKKDLLFSTIYLLSFVFISKIIIVASYRFENPKIAKINNYLISPNLNLLSNMNVTSTQIIRASLVGLAFTVVFGVLGYLVFKKQDIK